MSTSADACVVWIEVDGRQRYLFETDKLKEMLGASRVIADTVERAQTAFRAFNIFQVVSGEIGVWAPIEQRADLLQAAWRYRAGLVARGLEVTCGYLETSTAHFTSESGDLAGQVIRPIKRLTKEAKGKKTAFDATPSCSLFAPCRLHGWEFANSWHPHETDNVRRQMRGWRAEEKLQAWQRYRGPFTRSELGGPVQERLDSLLAPGTVLPPISFTDLSETDDDAVGQDQYVAFICADGDGMGPILSALNWNGPTGDGKAPWVQNAEFATNLDAAFRSAFRKALVEVILPDDDLEAARQLSTMQAPLVKVPMLPQVMGGDDLWIVCRRDVALDFACRFEAALRGVLSAQKLPPLTISFGIAFAKAGYPAHAMIAAAEHLLKTAKSRRKGLLRDDKAPEPTEGCIDWHWIESSISQHVADARAQGLHYSFPTGEESCEFLLTTRPWTATETRTFIEAERNFSRIARRKREQLEPILRMGLDRSRLQWERWCKSLDPGERAALADVGALLNPFGPLDPAPDHVPCEFWPWRELEPDGTVRRFRTPFLDLLDLAGPLKEKGNFLEEKSAFDARREQARERTNA